MEVKIDTKEKFTVITPETGVVDDNIAAAITQHVNNCLQQPVKNVVLNLSNILDIEENAARTIAEVQQNVYEQSASFVICSLQAAVEQKLDQLELLEIMNVTPTESEAWDIVQMEEIERELLDGDDFEFEKNKE
jgi:anti-anti-sigma factor